jgi:hypothetical protein
MINITGKDKNGRFVVEPEKSDEWIMNVNLPQTKLHDIDIHIDLDIQNIKNQEKAVKMIMFALKEAGEMIQKYCQHDKFDLMFKFNQSTLKKS